MSIKRGFFAVVDGVEGSGTTSIAKWLAKEHSFITTREPGGSPAAEAIRRLALKSKYAKDLYAETQFALMWAARFDHMRNTVTPYLEQGKDVVSDRFDASTWAYQIRGQDCFRLSSIFNDMRALYVRYVPDLYVILDVDPKIGLERVRKRKNRKMDHFDSRALSFHGRVRRGYLEFAAAGHCSAIVDASLPLKDVKELVWEAMRKGVTEYRERRVSLQIMECGGNPIFPLD